VPTPTWAPAYRADLKVRFDSLTSGLADRMRQVGPGRVAPCVEDIPIGSARYIRAAVLFFDISGFSRRTSSPDVAGLQQTLLMLDCVIPMVMHVIHDHGGYVEKNTGDGVMAVIGVEGSDQEAADAALDAAMTIFYVLNDVVNPYLSTQGIARVDAKIGIDLGDLLLARLGVATGSARQDRNFLTAVGPAANLACRLQEMADANEIRVGDLVRSNATGRGIFDFRVATPSGWPWVYVGLSVPYPVWRFEGRRHGPLLEALLAARLLRPAT
jgi:adenylate cyclase